MCSSRHLQGTGIQFAPTGKQPAAHACCSSLRFRAVDAADGQLVRNTWHAFHSLTVTAASCFAPLHRYTRHLVAHTTVQVPSQASLAHLMPLFRNP